MAKSSLSTDEIKKMDAAGETIEEIAAKAGITPIAIKARLSPEDSRKSALARHTGHPNESKRKSKEWHEKQQRLSLKDTTNHRRPWTHEDIKYLERHGRTKTTLEIARYLKRTFKGVEDFAGRRKISLRN